VHTSRLTRLGWLLSATMLLSNVVQAMEIQQFDKMASEDKGEYVSLLVGGAEQVLKDEGRADLAAKVEDLFTRILPGDQHSIGMVEFQLNLARARVTDTKNVAKDPHAQRLEVEDAMAVTLKKNGIQLPDSFFTVARNFQPKLPPPTAPPPQ
jgi:hypothetical protein